MLHACAAVRVPNAVPVADQSTGRHPLAAAANRRDAMTSSERDDLRAPTVKKRVGAYHEGVRALPLCCGESCIDLAHAAGFDDTQLPAQCPRGLLRSFPLVGDFRAV